MRWSTFIRPKTASLFLFSSLEIPSASTLSVRRATKLSSPQSLADITAEMVVMVTFDVLNIAHQHAFVF